MARIKVTLDHAAIRGILTHQFRPKIDELADEIAADAQAALDALYPGDGKLVDTQAQTTDRARRTVAIIEPDGARIEARYGVLQEAAHKAGLEVNDGA